MSYNGESLLKIAEEIALKVGRWHKKNISHKQIVTFQHEYDIKLIADIESETILRKELEKTHLPIIGEEKGGDPFLVNSEETYWVIDSLDGTYNYLREQPLSCVSIGLLKGRQPILGVIYDFNRDELFSGGFEKGIFLNRRLVVPKWPQEQSKACLMTGVTTLQDRSTIAFQAFLKKINQFQKIRMIGSAALSLAYVAVGRSDAYYETKIRLWDVAAGLALIRGAGGFYKMEEIPHVLSFCYNVSVAAHEEWMNYETKHS